MKNKILSISILAVSTVLALSACSGAKTKAVDTGITTAQMNASELLLLKTGTWKTSNMQGSDGKRYSGMENEVARVAGITRFNNNGTFRTVSMDTKSVFEGNWSISDDGRVLTMAGLGVDGRPSFRLDAPIRTLNNTDFSYRVIVTPNSNQYVDIYMTPASIDDSKILQRASSTNPNSLTNTY